MKEVDDVLDDKEPQGFSGFSDPFTEKRGGKYTKETNKILGER